MMDLTVNLLRVYLLLLLTAHVCSGQSTKAIGIRVWLTSPEEPCNGTMTRHVNRNKLLGEQVKVTLHCRNGTKAIFKRHLSVNETGFTYMSALVRHLDLMEEYKFYFQFRDTYWRQINVTEVLLGTLSGVWKGVPFRYDIKLNLSTDSRPPILEDLRILVVENSYNLRWPIHVEGSVADRDLVGVTLTAEGMPDQFKIIKTGGMFWLVLRETLDAEMFSTRGSRGPISFNFTLRATNIAGLSARATYEVEIYNVNDNTPTCEREAVIAVGRTADGRIAGRVAAQTSVQGNVNHDDGYLLDVLQYCNDADNDLLSPPGTFWEGKDCNGALSFKSGAPFKVFLRDAAPDGTTYCKAAILLTDGLHRTVFEFAVYFQDCSIPAGIHGYDQPEAITQLCRNGKCPPGFKDPVLLCGDDVRYNDPQYTCTSSAVYSLYVQLLNNRTDLVSAMATLREYTKISESEKKAMCPGDAERMSDILNILTDPSIPCSDEQNFTSSFCDIVNMMIDETNTDTWITRLNTTDTGVETVIQSVDSMAERMTQNLTTEERRQCTKQNLLLRSESRDKCVGDIRFPDSSGKEVPEWVANTQNSVRMACSGKTLVSNAIFKNVSKMIQSVTYNGSTWSVNAPVLSMSVHKDTCFTGFVTVTFQLFDKSMEDPMCSYWRFSNRKNGSGSWATDGCFLDSFDRVTGIVVCKCTHLTNFAVLMTAGPQVGEHLVALSIISTVGCSLSVICLVFTLVVYAWFWKKLSSERSMLIVHICSTLLVAYLLFLVGIERTENKYVCTAVAVLLHYVYLVVFVLMLDLGIYLTKLVLKPYSQRNLTPFYLGAAYSTPLVIVGICMAVTNLDGYGNERFCWLSVQTGLFWGFAGPVVVILSINVIIIVVVTVMFLRTAKMKKKSEKEKALAGLRTIAVLIPVLGITWVFGIFAVNEDTVAFQYLFAICNVLQGVLIMLTNCILDKKVQAVVKSYTQDSRQTFSSWLNS